MAWWTRRDVPVATSVAAARDPGPSTAAPAWRTAAALQRAVADHAPLINPPAAFRSTLATHQNPSFLGTLGHVVDPDGPAGRVFGMLEPVAAPAAVQRATEPATTAAAPGRRTWLRPTSGPQVREAQRDLQRAVTAPPPLPLPPPTAPVPLGPVGGTTDPSVTAGTAELVGGSSTDLSTESAPTVGDVPTAPTLSPVVPTVSRATARGSDVATPTVATGPASALARVTAVPVPSAVAARAADPVSAGAADPVLARTVDLASPASRLSESSVPDSSGPEFGVAESSGPDSSGPDSSGPDSSGPESSGPESSGPESSGPESSGPESSGPESSGPAGDPGPQPVDPVPAPAPAASLPIAPLSGALPPTASLLSPASPASSSTSPSPGALPVQRSTDASRPVPATIPAATPARNATVRVVPSSPGSFQPPTPTLDLQRATAPSAGVGPVAEPSVRAVLPTESARAATVQRLETAGSEVTEVGSSLGLSAAVTAVDTVPTAKPQAAGGSIAPAVPLQRVTTPPGVLPPTPVPLPHVGPGNSSTVQRSVDPGAHLPPAPRPEPVWLAPGDPLAPSVAQRSVGPTTPGSTPPPPPSAPAAASLRIVPLAGAADPAAAVPPSVTWFENAADVAVPVAQRQVTADTRTVQRSVVTPTAVAPPTTSPLDRPVTPNAGDVAVSLGVAQRSHDGSVLFPPPPVVSRAVVVDEIAVVAGPPDAAAPASAPVDAPVDSPADPSAAPAPAAAAPPATPGGPSAASAAPPVTAAGPAAGPDLDELARKLYDPIAARLKAEFRLDRERAGLLTDRRR